MGVELAVSRGPGKLTVLEAFLAQQGRNWPGLPKPLGRFEEKEVALQRCAWKQGSTVIPLFTPKEGRPPPEAQPSKVR